jgi:branched-chain amino acid transport system permease protein
MQTGLPKSGIVGLIPWIAALAVVWLCHFSVAPWLDPYIFTIVMYTGINITMAVSLNLVNGFTGQFSMGHAGFMAVGAYFSAYFTWTLSTTQPEVWQNNDLLQQGVFTLALLGGGLVASLAGYIVGLPSLRLKGDYLAIVTLGFGEIIRVILLNMDVVGGARGMPAIPKLASFGWVYSIVVICVFAVWRLVRSAYGRDLVAVREDEIAAVAMGVNNTRAKLRAFVISAFFSGIGGGLFAHYLMFLNPAIFDFNRSFEFIIMVVLGGMGSITGSIVAAIFLTAIREVLRDLQELRMIIYSLTLVLMMLVRPNGLFGTRELPDLVPRSLRFTSFKRMMSFKRT